MGKLQFNAPVGALFVYMLSIKDTTLWGSVSSMDRGMQAVPVLVEGGTQVQEHDVSEKFFLTPKTSACKSFFKGEATSEDYTVRSVVCPSDNLFGAPIRF